jgi:hypothetical protein
VAGLLLYTDGVTEAHRPRRELFGEHRLVAALRELPGSEPAAVVRRVLSDLYAHVGDEMLRRNLRRWSVMRSVENPALMRSASSAGATSGVLSLWELLP